MNPTNAQPMLKSANVLKIAPPNLTDSLPSDSGRACVVLEKVMMSSAEIVNSTPRVATSMMSVERARSRIKA